MFESFTAGALRVLGLAERRALARHAAGVENLDLITALLDDSESRAASALATFGLEPARFFAAIRQPETLPDDSAADDSGETHTHRPQSALLRAILAKATSQAKAFDRSRSVGTEHLLVALIDNDPTIADRLASAGLDLPALRDSLDDDRKEFAEAIPLAADLGPLVLTEPGEGIQLGRILDASANRAREGLRVVEDYARFALDDPFLTKRLKEVRHRLSEAIRGFDPDLLIGSRDTRGDVGTHIMTASESSRENPRAVLAANFKRTGEALRTLEEYGKLVDVWVAGRFEVLRYDVYTLEKLMMTAIGAAKVLGDCRLMVLVGGMPTLGDLTWIVGEALAGGAQAIQIREKGLDDRTWLTRAREVRILTAKAGAKLIVNDRPDLARLAGADGVHLGQDDMTLRDARRIVGPSALVGVSTHDGAQLDRALLDSASYLGVGPVFESETKRFDDFAGLSFVRRAAETSKLPWFAIGGIDESTIDEVIEAGARRVAVSGGVVRAEYPRKAAAALRAKLDSAG